MRVQAKVSVPSCILITYGHLYWHHRSLCKMNSGCSTGPIAQWVQVSCSRCLGLMSVTAHQWCLLSTRRWSSLLRVPKRFKSKLQCHMREMITLRLRTALCLGPVVAKRTVWNYDIWLRSGSLAHIPASIEDINYTTVHNKAHEAISSRFQHTHYRDLLLTAYEASLPERP